MIGWKHAITWEIKSWNMIIDPLLLVSIKLHERGSLYKIKALDLKQRRARLPE